MAIQELKLSEVQLSDEAQPRERIDLDVIGEYAEVLKAGGTLPPIVVFGSIVADGFHRHMAHQSAGRKTISAIVNRGGLREAILYSCSANAIHGLRRTNADKRRAVLKLLRDPVWREWSDRKFARMAAVSNPFVSEMRATVGRASQITERLVERGESVYRQKVRLRPTHPKRKMREHETSKETTSKDPTPGTGANLDPSVKRILSAIALLARSDVTKFLSALARPQREGLVPDIFKARKFLNAL